jgi:uncharacterized repeat protein (TIGR03943 family)
VTRDVGSALLVLVGAAILRIASGDTYLRYVKASMRPWLLTAGSILVVLGLLALLDVWRSVRAESRARAATTADPHDEQVDGDHTDDDRHHDIDAFDDGHGHGSRLPRAAWLLVLPVAALFVVPPPALGAFTAERQQATTVAPAVGAAPPPLPAGAVVPLPLNDFASRAVWDDGRTLQGRTVSLTGFASAAPGGGWYLTRLALTCCAADATVTKITVKGGSMQPATNQWVTVVGHWVPGGGTESETAIPWIQAQAMTPQPAPKDPYE